MSNASNARNARRVYTARGTIESPQEPEGRGTSHRTPGGALGIYVGTTPVGRAWYAYDPADFPALCADFDARYR